MHVSHIVRALAVAPAILVVCSCSRDPAPAPAAATTAAPLAPAPVEPAAHALDAAAARVEPAAHALDTAAARVEHAARPLDDGKADAAKGGSGKGAFANSRALASALNSLNGIQGVHGPGVLSGAKLSALDTGSVRPRGVEIGGAAGGLATSGIGRGGGGSGYGMGGGGAVSGRVSVAYPMTFSGGGGAAAPAARPDPAPMPGGTFVHAGVNPIVDAKEDHLSTFSIDVDTGSWMYARRFLKMGRPPEPASVRVEEFVNALHYEYAGPSTNAFAIHVDAAPSPFTREHHVVRVAIQGKRMTADERKPAHVTFLVDVSGSMMQEDKLPWARDAVHTAVNAMRDDDSVAIVTYAGETRLVLPSTRVSQRAKIHAAVDTLQGGGSTNMGSGMEMAYREANKELGSERSARVMVLSDGDANIGHTTHEDILKSITGYVSEGVTMSTVGFGTGNYNDRLMEQLADAGNGNYTYIDSRQTMKRVFADELTSTLEVIAQDAKIQVDWNPEVVRTYRLLGYENRDIADKDFRNDKKDAGEIGAGHAVTALYEIRLVDPARTPSAKLGTVRVRHKIPRHEHATEVAVDISPEALHDSTGALDADAQAALGMALGAEILRGSEHAAGLTLVDAAKLLRASAHGKYAAERNEAAELFEKAPTRTVAAR